MLVRPCLIQGLCGIFSLFFGASLSAQTESPRWSRRPLTLATEVSETSGLMVTEEGIWTFNDSGGKPEIYLLDTLSGKVIRTVKIHQALNKDWEAGMISGERLYIADTGNNQGKRTDLKVYACTKPTINDSVLIPSAEYRFRWPDELYGVGEEKTHDRDCEAMVYMQDSLFLLTKSWKTLSLKLAHLKEAPVQIAYVVDSLPNGYLITDAVFREDIPGKGRLLLLGYENKIPGDVWLWILEGNIGSEILKGRVRAIKLGNALQLGQTEGIAFIGPEQIVISAEKFGLNARAVLHFLDIRN